MTSEIKNQTIKTKKLTYKRANEILNKYGYAMYKHGKNNPYIFLMDDENESPMLREDSLNTYTLDVWTEDEIVKILLERIHDAIQYNHGLYCNKFE